MSNTYYLAVDIGASSGRHILGWIEDGKLKIEEVYRFENRTVKRGGHICWEVDRLFEEIISGMKKCGEIGKIPVSMGIDCFGVDFVLLDSADNILGDTVAYRDTRTEAVIDEVNALVPDSYAITGIAPQVFNTIYQLYAIKKENGDILEKAQTYLMLTEYFNFLLTGEKLNEYTNGTTTQLVNAETKQYDKELLDKLGIPARLFGKLHMPGTEVGELSGDISARVGYSCRVVLPATHDTGSAVAAVPTSEKCLYISSGTWSLMGTLIDTPNCSKQCMDAGFTNEGGVRGIRLLKNIMGLWIIQSVRRELDKKYSFDELCAMAQASEYPHSIDVDDGIFFSPDSMIEAIKTHLKGRGVPEPDTIGAMVKAIYSGLAAGYARAAEEIEAITGEKYESLHIIGGGSRDTYLNSLTAAATGKRVYAGPSEATAIGNLVVQLTASGEISYNEAAQLIADSFEVEEIRN